MTKHQKHRTTKHEMKEDKFISSVMGGAKYARENVQSVMIVVVIIIAIIAGGIYLQSSRINRKEAAATKLGLAQIAYDTENYIEAKDTLLSLANSFPKTDAAKTGFYLLGHLYFALGKMDSAEVFWNKFLESEMDDADMKAASEAGIAGIMSNNREFEGAAQIFESIYENYPEYFDRGNMLWLAAINYQGAGQIQKSAELLEKYLDEFEDGSKSMNTKLMLAEMKAN